jgi:hypothetical protein
MKPGKMSIPIPNAVRRTTITPIYAYGAVRFDYFC